MATEIETWKNVSLGKRGIVRVDPYGKTVHELISPGKNVQLSRDDRLHYQRSVATDSLDIFQNGALVPVVLVNEEDKTTMASNPNLLSEDELVGLFKLQWKKFESEIAKISNIYALERLVEVAKSSDEVTVKKLNVVEDRYQEIKQANAHTTAVAESIARSSRKNSRDAF